MYINSSNHSSAARARRFMALFAVMLAMGLGVMVRPVEAAPFAYVANENSNNVSVIDTATNTVVATVLVGNFPSGVAVTPDGKHVYVTNSGGPGSVSVIETASNMVVATIAFPVGLPSAVAITPDGKHAYVANFTSNTVSVIDTATNMVVGTPIPVGMTPFGVAVTPDGTQAYVTNLGLLGVSTVSVIATASNSVVATVAVGTNPAGVAVTPNGKHAYVANGGSNSVSVIATATNTVVATVAGVSTAEEIAMTPDGKHAYVTNELSKTVSVIDTATNTVEPATLPVGLDPLGVAITPDGKHAYVANLGSNPGTVLVIDTATNNVVATVGVGNEPSGVGIIPPPPGTPFLALSANLEIAFGTAPNQDAFVLGSGFTLSSTAPVINPLTAAVTLQIGTFAVTIPPGSFKKNHAGDFIFTGVINGVTLEAVIKPTGTLRYAFQAKAAGANFTGTQNTVYLTLAIGGDSGATSVTAMIFH
jgi:YVTN family beta-propeller protein